MHPLACSNIQGYVGSCHQFSRHGKEIKAMQIGEDKIKLSLFTDDVIVFLKI
jgi:hypothetical protein